MTVQNHQARPVALLRGMLGYEIGRELKIKIRDTHRGRKRETPENVDAKI
jgi:hypothetical protein